MKAGWKIWIGVGSVCVIMIVLFFFFNPKQNEEEEILWREYTVEKGNIMASFDEDGVLELEGDGYEFPYSKYDVSFLVKEVFVEEGQIVHEGDALISFDKEKIEKVIQDVQGELDDAKTELENAKENLKNAN